MIDNQRQWLSRASNNGQLPAAALGGRAMADQCAVDGFAIWSRSAGQFGAWIITDAGRRFAGLIA